jgi:hypothetical protein
MYVRFIVLAPRRRRPFGLFRAKRQALDDVELPAWLREQVAAQYEWFSKNLRVPRNRNGGLIDVTGVCWFRAEAREHIAHARQLAWLLAEADHPTEMITTRHPGQILYRDDIQIVAKPDARTRVA